MLENIPDYVPYTLLILFSIGLGVYLFKDTVRFGFKAKQTNGRIVNWMSATEKGKKYFYPVIEFQPEGAETQRVRLEDRCEGEPMYSVGTILSVKYDSNNFKNIRVTYPKKTS